MDAVSVKNVNEIAPINSLPMKADRSPTFAASGFLLSLLTVNQK